MYQHQHKRKKRDFTEAPSMDNLVEAQEWLQDLFETVIETLDKQLLVLYNKTATAYNAAACKTIFLNFQNPSQMAKTKQVAAAQEAAATPTPKTAAAKKAAAQTPTPKAVVETIVEARPPSQKETVIAEAEAGLSVNEIVEKHGFIKTNVSWYFSKHKLHEVPAQVERKANEAAAKAAAKAAAAAPVAEPVAAAPAPAKKAASAQKTK